MAVDPGDDLKAAWTLLYNEGQAADSWGAVEMEKGGGSGRATCAIFHSCVFVVLSRVLKKVFAFFSAFYGIFAHFCMILSFFCTYFVC